MAEPARTPEPAAAAGDDSAARSPDSTAAAAPAAARGPDGQPRCVGRYEVRRVLGEGACGRVYLAVDPELGREVAIKVPKADALTPGLRERFLREARTTARIRHANVCPILDVGTDGDVPFLVMQFVPGGTLGGVLKERREPYPARDAAAVVRKLALGVAAAHAQDVLHRDLKPANVLWDEANGEVLLTDFGLARLADAARLSVSGVPVGTPLYMSPEQFRGRSAEIGPPADVYSLGVILYELVTGGVPFPGESFWEVMTKVAADEPRPPSEVRPGLDPRVDALCARAMAKKPEDRYQSARAFADALADFLQAPAPPVGAAGSVPVVRDRAAAAPVGQSPERGHWAGESPQHRGADPRRGRPAARASVSYNLGLLLLTGGLAAWGAAVVWWPERAGLGTTGPPPTPPGPVLPAHPTAGDPYSVRVGDPAVEMRFSWIPPGKFRMGGNDVPDNPARQVTITNGFWMGQTEVTQAQWLAVMGNNPSAFRGDDRPVERVRWNDAQEFCTKLTATLPAQAGKLTVRLPTEAEWEFACRARTTTEFWCGDGEETFRAVGWNWGNRPSDATQPVGKLRANPWGLFDVHGNVWEWCRDGYGGLDAREAVDPIGNPGGGERVLRGGCWNVDARECSSAHRSKVSPEHKDHFIGFRVCFRPD